MSKQSLKAYVNPIINKSFLILDQIHESHFPYLEKLIYFNHSSEKIDKNKISKIEFVIQQRIKHVENNCKELEAIVSKLPDNDVSKVDVISRIKQLCLEQKRILSSFKNIQLKKIEKERLEKEQEDSLTRRFTTNIEINDQNKDILIDINENFLKEKLNISKSNNSNLMKIRNQQKPLVKRVRTRYLNFSRDFFGMTKVFLKHTWIDWFFIVFLFVLILIGVAFVIIWQITFYKNSEPE